MDTLRKQFKKGTDIKMTEAEKSVARFSLVSYIESHGVSSVHSPIDTEILRPIRSPYLFVGFMKALALVLILVVASGGALTYASERALPGDVLYGFKTKVREPAELALASTPQQRLLITKTHIEKRLKEIETLKTTNTFTEAQAAIVADTLASNAEDLTSSLDEVNQTGDTTTGTEVIDSLQPQLAVYENTTAEENATIPTETTPEVTADTGTTTDSTTPTNPEQTGSGENAGTQIVAPKMTAEIAPEKSTLEKIAPTTTSEEKETTTIDGTPTTLSLPDAKTDEQIATGVNVDAILSKAVKRAQNILLKKDGKTLNEKQIKRIKRVLEQKKVAPADTTLDAGVKTENGASGDTLKKEGSDIENQNSSSADTSLNDNTKDTSGQTDQSKIETKQETINTGSITLPPLPFHL